ncbi:MAG: flagellar basal body rod protein FlgB [Janthinobacterium lividum]
MTDIPILSQLENYLSVTNKRATVISSNMANVDTPGYHTRDIDFQHELSRALKSDGSHATPVQVSTVSGLMERPDGNNVDVDRESVLLSEAQLQYQVGTQLMKSRFHELMSAINGDK